MSQTVVAMQSAAKRQEGTTYKILIIIGLTHLLNDSIQAVIPAMFPILEKSMGLTFKQLGLIAFALNIVSSIMQPIVGMITDRRPMPWALPIGLTSTLFGVLGLAFAPNFQLIIISVLFIGLGSAIFHPEGSRVAYMAAGTRRGLAQSIYQVGGNSGQALAPLITAVILVPLGQRGAALFSLVAALAVVLLIYIAFWYTNKLKLQTTTYKERKQQAEKIPIPQPVKKALLLVLILIFVRSWYISGMTNFYTFYTMHKYNFSIEKAQIFLFAFLLAGAVGTFFGGPLADRFGKKNVIFISMIGAAPLTVLLPYVSPVLAFMMLILIGFILMSSFSVTVVYAQELVPGKIGTMAGLTVGLAFGMGALGSVALGSAADLIGLPLTIMLTGLLPFIGLFTVLLPSDVKIAKWNEAK